MRAPNAAPSSGPDVQPHPTSDSSRLLEAHQRAGIRALLITLITCAPLVTVAVFFREGLTPLWWITAVLTLSVGAAGGLFLKGHELRAAQVLLAAVLAGSVLAIAVQGTVRSAAVLVLFATVTCAGALLSTRALIATAATSIGALAALNALEQWGWLRKANLDAGFAVWLTQSAVLVTVLISVYFGRQRLTAAIRDQEQALIKARKTEARLRQSERRFAALFRSNPAATLVQHIETQAVLEVNEAFVRVFGLTHAASTLFNPNQLWHSVQERRQFQTLLLENHRVSAFQATAQRPDGSTFDAQVFGELVVQDTDTLLVLMVLDVSEQEHARKRVERSEERFSKAFHHSPLGMTIARLSDGRFMEANPANEKVLGFKPEDFVGTAAPNAPIWLNQADQMRYWQTLTREGKLEAYEMRLRHQQRGATDVRLWAEMIELEGEAAVLTFTMDVSEEKRREAQLLDLATGVSGDTGLPFFRSLVRHMSKALGADLVLVGEFHTPDTVQTLAAYFNGALVPTNLEYPIAGTPCEHAAAHMGDCFFAERLAEQYPMDAFPIGGGYSTYMGVALHDAQGSLIGMLKAMWVQPKASSSELQALMSIFSSRCNAELNRLRRDRDVQKLSDTLEQRVAERTAQLEYLNRELDSFSYTVSHDLKSPLRSIDGFMHVLREQMADRIRPEDQVVMARIQGAVDRMSQLIHDLLALARVSQNTLKRQWVDLSPMALDVLRVEQQRDPGRLVDIRVAPGLRAFCDPHLSRIVLENLLGNAWKYSRDTACPCIEFGQAHEAHESDPVFCVRDNGAGFDMSRANRLFKPFNRLHSAREFEGSGVGLATVRRIIERHGGHIAGEGEVGRGSSFRFSFGHSVD